MGKAPKLVLHALKKNIKLYSSMIAEGLLVRQDARTDVFIVLSMPTKNNAFMSTQTIKNNSLAPIKIQHRKMMLCVLGL